MPNRTDNPSDEINLQLLYNMSILIECFVYHVIKHMSQYLLKDEIN